MEQSLLLQPLMLRGNPGLAITNEGCSAVRNSISTHEKPSSKLFVMTKMHNETNRHVKPQETCDHKVCHVENTPWAWQGKNITRKQKD